MATAAGRIGDTVKRILLGRALTSEKLEHQLLPKTLALPVFSSDPISSVAYATEEIMLALAVAGALALRFTVPIAIGIAILLAIVITSYRQTVRAYPRGGGSYIVARENLGTIPGLTAAASILIGYVVTAAVSVTAGTVALTSAVPGLVNDRVPIAIGFIALIAMANLRGVRESGLLFAIPTYGFVAMIYATLLTGVVRCLGGCPEAATSTVPLEAHEALGALLLLKAFTQGSAALTGVEAIADGVQAFRKPQGRNAAATMTIMGSISITMFVGITLMARALDVRVTHEIAVSKSVLSQIGETLFGRGFTFFALQTFTMLILVVAANTAYQDFPRLSAILARDHFMPRQFMNRGDRLVFSNGIVVLSVAAALLVWAFDATLTRLIPLYLVSVVSAFTLSQSGMVRRWLRLREGKWKRNVILNGVGALVTGIVLAVAIATRFHEGAWMVIAAIPVIILLLLWVYRHYEHVRRQLRRGSVFIGMEATNSMVLVVPQLDHATREMVSWVHTVRADSVRPVWVGEGGLEDVQDEWRRMAPSLPPLAQLPRERGEKVTRAVRRFVGAIPRGDRDFVTVVVPEAVTSGLLMYLLRRTLALRIKTALLFERGVVIVDVPLLPVEAERAAQRAVRDRAVELERNVCIVPVSGVHDATIRALVYAKSLQPSRLEAIFLAGEPEEADPIIAAWREQQVDIPLTVVEAPFREYGPPLLDEIRRSTARPDTVVTVVMPEFVVTKWRHALLHNQRGLYFKRILLYEPWVVAVSVPYRIESGR